MIPNVAERHPAPCPARAARRGAATPLVRGPARGRRLVALRQGREDSQSTRGALWQQNSEHEGGTRDPRTDHVRIPKEIALIPGRPRASPREEPSLLEGAQRGTFHVRNGAQWGSRWGGRPVLRTADLYRVNLEVQHLKTFGSVAFPIPITPKTVQNTLVLLTNC